MIRVIKAIQTTLVFFVIGIPVLAQDSGATRAQFVVFMKKSFELTKQTPYRSNTTVEMADNPTSKDWMPYSSWVVEYMFPDRSHIVYKTRGRGEYVQIGETRYSKNTEGPWVITEAQSGWTVTNPATPIALSETDEFYSVTGEGTTGNAAGFRIVHKPEPGAEDFAHKVVTWTFWFDDNGILFKNEDIGFNGKNWVRTTRIYEYDTDIKIEAPSM